MRIFQDFDTITPILHPAITVGSYDGVHLGHRAILERLAAEARAIGGESVVITFEPHPRIALGKAEGMLLLTSLDEKIALLELLRVDNLVIVPFDEAFRNLSGAEFVERILVGRLGAETIVMGYNHRFGHDRCDSYSLPRPEGLNIVCVEQYFAGDAKVSSTIIRHLLAQGRTADAEQLLGHPLKINVKE